LLFEYAATLGMIDVAYVNPAARAATIKRCGARMIRVPRRYDGLIAFRLNPLGAYGLGLAPAYAPGQIEARAQLTVLPSLQINVRGGALSPDEALLLETYAERETDTVWRLDRDKAIAAVESGNHLAELRAFLQARDAQPLPEMVESFITTTERQARALHNKGPALLIECADVEIADLVAHHESTEQPASALASVRGGMGCNRRAFRKALHTLGYGCHGCETVPDSPRSKKRRARPSYPALHTKLGNKGLL
jgi:hypothetical protein